jgi:hypothetical protein
MTEGMFKLVHEQLGEAVRISWGASPECFVTKENYEAKRYDPPYDELPTRDEYIAGHKNNNDA